MKLFQGTDVKVIVQKDGELTDAQIANALKVPQSTMWWRAITQLVDATRQDYIGRASGGADRNNPLGMARDIGSHEALTSLLEKLSELSAD